MIVTEVVILLVVAVMTRIEKKNIMTWFSFVVPGELSADSTPYPLHLSTVQKYVSNPL